MTESGGQARKAVLKTHHEIKSDETPSFIDSFTDVMTFPEGKPATNLWKDQYGLRIGSRSHHTGVPVEGATVGSSASTSKLK